jgi:hypothetical protein
MYTTLSEEHATSINKAGHSTLIMAAVFSLEHLYTATRLHSITFQKTVTFTVTAMETQNLAKFYFFVI